MVGSDLCAERDEMAMTRGDLHRLLDTIPEGSLERAQRALEPLVDPFVLALEAAQIDDEPETDEERKAVAEAREDIVAGRVRPWDDVRHELARD